MSSSRLQRRSGPVFGACLTLLAGALAFSPLVPTVQGSAPRPAPSATVRYKDVVSPAAASADATPAPDPLAPTPTPAATPTATPVLPDPAPTATPALPDPTPTPDATSTPPPVDPTPTPDPVPTPTPTPTPEPTPTPAPTATPAPAGGLSTDEIWIDTTDPQTDAPIAGTAGRPLTGAEKFRPYEVRFQVRNTGDTSVTLTPKLAWSISTDATGLTALPEGPVEGQPLYVALDNGATFKARVDTLSVASLRATGSSDPNGVAVEGERMHGVNPGPSITLAPHAWTEIVFAVRATMDAQWQTTYELRLLDDKAAVANGIAYFETGAKPALDPASGEKSGISVSGSAATPAYALSFQPFMASGLAAQSSVTFVGPLAQTFTSPHDGANYALDTDACAACHAAHTAGQEPLLRGVAPQSSTCFACHDGTGAVANVKAQYTVAGSNDTVNGIYYSHPAATLSSHESATIDEFGGQLNRHAACADCHAPHNSTGTLSSQTANGWTASGSIAGITSVSVVNAGAGMAPTYTWQTKTTLEYQLCFKCHSGYTVLPSPIAGKPSRDATDTAIEFNPANLSYHPVEAAGKNQTAIMTRNLVGTSQYKLWNFTTTSTIRCLNCHGNSALATPASPPSAGAQLDPHAGPKPGVLMNTYRNGDPITGIANTGLKPRGQGYSLSEYALCLQCHADAPFRDTQGAGTNVSAFDQHGLHTGGALFDGSPTASLDINVAGAGQGNALCSECHFRTHSTTAAVNGQLQTTHLVNFAPDVLPNQDKNPWVDGKIYYGKLEYTGSSCTLTCHGVNHYDWGY